jgi:CBS-domain-containing membrane protein
MRGEEVIVMKTTIVSDVMTTSVMLVREDADFKEMVTVMRSRSVSALPVLDAADRVIGQVSEVDLLAKEEEPEFPRGLIWLAWPLTERSKAAGMTAAR